MKTPTPPKDPELQGEGNYTASRRHRKSVESFVKDGRVEPSARDAEPRTEGEAQAMKEAEEEGLRKARD